MPKMIYVHTDPCLAIARRITTVGDCDPEYRSAFVEALLDDNGDFDAADLAMDNCDVDDLITMNEDIAEMSCN